MSQSQASTCEANPKLFAFVMHKSLELTIDFYKVLRDQKTPAFFLSRHLLGAM